MPDSVTVEQCYVTERGRRRPRFVRIDLDEVRRGLGIPTAADRSDWQRIRELLEETVGESTFAIWLEPVELIAVDSECRLVVAVPSVTAAWTAKRFGRLLANCSARVGRELRLAAESECIALGRGDGRLGASGAGLAHQPTGGVVMVTVVANQKGGVGKTTTAANIGVLLARRGGRVLVVDTDPQFALTRQLGLDARSLGVNLVDVLAGRASATDAIVRGVHGVDVIPAAAELAGVEMSLVGELGRERFLHDALEALIDEYDEVVIDTPPNLGLLTVNALVCADYVLAPVSAEDEGAVHGILELRVTIAKLAKRLGGETPPLIAVVTRWSPTRVSSRTVEDQLTEAGLPPVARIRLRSALVAEAAAARVPVATLAPDSCVALAYGDVVELLAGTTAR